MTLLKKNVIVTGSAGFIGFHMTKKLLSQGWNVIGIDNLNPYYDISLKLKRHEVLKKNTSFSEVIGNIEDDNIIKNAIKHSKPDIFIHLAAQAGVRYSLDNPETYIKSNLLGTFKVIESLREYKVKHFLAASTSSVYGNSPETPYNEKSNTDFPVSFYASTKKGMEVITHNYSHLYNIPTTIFRFFTVYGPWGRPDMALFKFTNAILKNEPIQIYNHGKMKRDFTYVDDLIESIYRLIQIPPEKKENTKVKIAHDLTSNFAPWRVVNIGNSKPIELLKFIETLELVLNKKAIKNYLPYQRGEVLQTWSDNGLLEKLIKFKPNTELLEGIKKFINWYYEFYKI